MSVRSYTGSSKASFFAKRQHRKQTLSVIVCGASGTGKTAFINTFFGRRIHESSHVAADSGLRMVPVTSELDEPLEDGSRLVLTMIDCENFATALTHGNDVEQLAYYIECRFDEVLAEESRIRRNPKFKDGRVDACLYFIEPTGHGLREIDILTLRRLVPIVNVIPVLARADTLTPAERVAAKRMVMEDLRMHDIAVFDFRYDADEYDDVPDPEIAEALPLAVTTASDFDSTGAVVFRRVLSYGVVDVLNPEHSDFAMLRDALLSTHRTELKERTHEVLYETYRTNRLDPQRNHRSSLLLPQELAGHAARLKEAQLAREAESLREDERRVNAEIEAKRNLLLRRERELRELEMRMAEVRPQYPAPQDEPTSEQQRVRQTRSKRELREHTSQLHAEVADLEAQKQNLQERQLATAASSRSVASQNGKIDAAAPAAAATLAAPPAPAAARADAPARTASPHRAAPPPAPGANPHPQTAAPPVPGTPNNLHPRHNLTRAQGPEDPAASAVDLGDFVDVSEEPLPDAPQPAQQQPSPQPQQPFVPQAPPVPQGQPYTQQPPVSHVSTISEESLSFVQNTSPLQIKKTTTANSDY